MLVGVCLHRGIADPELLDGDGVGEIPARFILSETLLALTASKKRSLESESKASAARHCTCLRGVCSTDT